MNLREILCDKADPTVGSLTSSETYFENLEYGDHAIPPWLEKEACDVLSKSRSLDEIRLIYSYIPFQDQNTPCNLLSKRWKPDLDAFLNTLHNRNPSALDQDCKDIAEEILSLLGPKPPPFVTWDWKWTPPVVASAEDAARAAEVIDFNVCRIFCKIPFWAWVRAWLGHKEAFVTSFLEGVSNMSNKLYQYLQELHQPKHMYKQVEMELRYRHPLACWVVSSSLQRLVCPGRLANPYEALGFLFHSIAPLFKGQSLVRTIKKLEVLAVRFDDKVLVAERVNWESPFVTDFSFLRTIRDIDPEKIAAKITEIDCKRFSYLRPRDFDVPDRTFLLYMGEQWNTIADNVKACVIADSNLVQPLCKLVVHLFGLWNYHSGTAVLTGLNNAKGYHSKLLILPKLIERESRLSIFWNIINTENNYQCYRELWSKNPGLPFLFPHCVELRRASNEGRVIGEIFTFTSTLKWKNESRRLIADDLRDHLDEKFVDRLHYYIDRKTQKDNITEKTTLSSTCGFTIPASESNVETTGGLELETQEPKRRRIAVLTSALPLKQASSQDSLMLSKRIEKGDATWYIFNDKTATTKEGSLNDVRCTETFCKCKI